MSDTLLNIVIKAQNLASRQIDIVKNSMSKLQEKAFQASENGLNFVKNKFEQLKTASVFAIAGVAAVSTALFGLATNSAMSNETMQIALKTAFGGNAELANKASKNIKEFAKTTPYETKEVMNSFIKLKNLGLDPSTKALTAYGNTASGMGKDLNQMIEAVADASTGEFERLKEFGIKASKQGDKVAFTFQGVTKTISNNSKDIETYLQNIGNVNFVGGMEAQSKSLSGIISTMKDNFTFALTDFIESSGIYDQIKNIVNFANSYFEKIDFKIVGENTKVFFDKTVDYIKTVFSILTSNFEGSKYLEEDSPFLAPFFGIINFYNENKETIENFKNLFIDQIMFKFKILSDTFTSITPILQVFWDYIIWACTYLANVIFPFLTQQMSKFQSKWESDLAPAISTAVAIMKPAIEDLINTFKKIVEFIVPILLPIISKLIDIFLWAFPLALTGFAKTFAIVASTISWLVSGIINNFNWLYSTMTNIGNNIINFFTFIPKKIGDSFKSIGNFFIDDINKNIGYVNSFINTIKEITGQNWIPNLYTIPRFENGGVVGGNSYTGDKILARVNSGELILNQKQQNKLNNELDNSNNSDKKEVNVTININGPAMFTESNKKEFVKSIAYQLKLLLN
jgi:hypothetical protein